MKHIVKHEVTLTKKEKEAFETVITVLDELSNIRDLELDNEDGNGPLDSYAIDEMVSNLDYFYNLDCVHTE